MANNPLVGAWERVSDSSVGVLIYTGSHYAAVMAPKDRQRSSGERATPDEALEALLSCPALAGTYTLSGSRITQVRESNTRPELSKLSAVFDYTIDGDTMTQTVVSGTGGAAASGSSLTFRRIPGSDTGSPLVGAWEMVDDTEQGVIIFTGTHHAVVRMHKERDLPKGEQYTPEEALTALYTSGAQAGPYTLSGTTLTLERTAHLRPERVGENAVLEVAVEGDTLKTRAVSGLSVSDVTWRKVS